MQDEALDLREILDNFRRWWWVLLASPLLIGGIIAGAGLASPVPAPKYEATATMLLEGSAATASYPSLIVTRPFLKGVIDQTALPLSVDEIKAMLSARRVEGTQFLEVRAISEEPAMARRIADAVAVTFVGHMDSIREEQFAAQREELSRQMSAMGLFSTSGAVLATLSGVIEQRMPEFGRVTLVAPAEVPGNPVSVAQRPIARNAILGAAAGLLLSVGLVMLLGYQRAAIGSAAMFQRRFGIPNLGVVPRWPKSAGGARILAVNGASSTGEAEAIRQVATNIEFAARDKGIKSLVVTSPDTGEGRSSLIANLGCVLSSGQEKVVLVDADLRRPSLHAYFKLQNTAGLSDFLSNPEIEMEDVLRDTVYSGVKVITSGPPAADPVALLKTPRMGALLKQLESEYHMVLVDTPPLVSLADGAVVAAQVGGSVMVVNSSNTRMDAVVLALGNLEKAGANMLGFIWNGVTSGSPGRYSRYQKHCRKQSEAGRSVQLVSGSPT
ncbi:MAG: polysaccharide biosynthesis tyrosine autokinase [Chloroflexi bacterium]|nr:polysaccharide biosynthesis tyrosine autokinase [Chloroflexota bacterium]